MAGNDTSRNRSRKSLPIDGQDEPIEDEVIEPEVVDEFVARSETAEEDIVDAEVVDEESEDERPRSASRTWREIIREKVRPHFGPDGEKARAKQERQQKIDAERLEWDDDSDLSEKDRVLKMRSQIRTAGETYMQSIRDSGLTVPGYGSTDEKVDHLDRKRQVHLQMMLQSCITPLARGVRPTTVVQAAGMFMAMRMLSKDFRNETGKYTSGLKEAIQNRADRKIDAEVSRAEWGIANRQGFFANVKDPVRRDRLVGSTNPRDHLRKKHQKRFDDLQRRRRGHREVFTPESAAMTEVALLEDAYWTMRDPATDNAEVRKGYRSLRARLHEQMAEDGLDREEVSTQARIIMRERMEQDPTVRTMVNGFGHGRIVMSEPHEEQITGTNQVRKVWRGEIEDENGVPIEGQGMFTLREPMTPESHQVMIASVMENSLLRGVKETQEGKQGSDVDLDSSVCGYLIGFATKKSGYSLEDYPADLRRRVDQSHVMTASMEMDGLSDEQQLDVYSNGFVDAMKSVREKVPGFGKILDDKLGVDWQERMTEAVQNPGAFMAERAERIPAERRARQAEHEASRVYEAGPDAEAPPTATYTDDHQPA